MSLANAREIERITGARDPIAERNRVHLRAASVYGINLMASPGGGKTSLILRTIQALSGRLRIGVVEGDTTAVTIDSAPIIETGVPVVQINTGSCCHLDATMLSSALERLPLADLDLLIVENIGNLVCSAARKLGVHSDVLIASVPEGDDKPYKYPNIYRNVDAVVLNKTDLLPYVEFDLSYFRRGVEQANPGVPLFPLSSYTGADVHRWVDWVSEKCPLPKHSLSSHGG